MSKLVLFGALAWVATSTSVAATTVLNATGVVTSIGAIQGEHSVAPPSGAINIGDIFTLSARFDESRASLSSLFNTDPGVNIFALPGTTVEFSIGSYAPQFPSLYNFNASTQLWNDLADTGAPIDAQSFSFVATDMTPGFGLPFDLGAGQQLAFLDLYAFDSTATARSNNLISDYAPLSAFDSKSFSFGQFNSNTSLYVFVGGNVFNWTVSAVPEPGMWGMMIFGLGAVGCAIRRHRAGNDAGIRRSLTMV